MRQLGQLRQATGHVAKQCGQLRCVLNLLRVWQRFVLRLGLRVRRGCKPAARCKVITNFKFMCI